MKKILFLIALLPLFVNAQIEKVIVETYYISDSIDATDSNGGYLAPGSTTYRVYVDLIPGSKLKKIYGDAYHALKFFSTDTFFNNLADGQTFAKEFAKTRYGDNTVALDSWLTIGQTTRTSSKTYFGALKNLDDDGSFVGGVNNDGGSAGIATGLLTNADPLAGIPLTTADGMDTISITPTSWGDYGIIDFASGDDSTVFGSIIPGNEFVSYNAGLFNSGVGGVIADSNHVLVAQLTTKGNISFEINVEVLDTSGNIIKYVANDSTMLAGEILNRSLKYPYAPVCGCPDANYVEFLSSRDCDEQDSCKTLIVFGCMDTLACNYSASANFNVQSLCCYPGYCNDRDLEIVCPQITNERKGSFDFSVYPNPANDVLHIKLNAEKEYQFSCFVFDAFGRVVTQDILENTTSSHTINTSSYVKGIYLLRIFDGKEYVNKVFQKN